MSVPMIDFSIIIPAKNEETYIAGCLDSINAVAYPADRFEVLVIDNGSTDRTEEIAREKGAKVFRQPDLTISGLRNYGASRAQGRVLAFLDADCAVSDSWLHNAAVYLDRPEMAAFGSAPVVPVDATWVQKVWFLVRKKKNIIEDVSWLESMNLFVPAEVFRSINGFNEHLVTCEDYELSTRLRTRGKIVSDQRILAIHHGEATSVAHFFRKERWRATSNYRGLRFRHVERAEVLSIVMPLIQLLLLIIFILLDEMTVFGYINVLVMLGFLLIWQLPLVLLALKKCSWKKPLVLLELTFLLNIYFLARGFAIFGGGR